MVRLKERDVFRRSQLEQFWELWHKEYIRNLPPVLKGGNVEHDVPLGSLVMISEDNVPRLQWTLGSVVKLHHGKDGIVRAADIKTASGVKCRPVQRLHLLETDDVMDKQDNNVSQVDRCTRSGRVVKPVDKLNL